jgi:sugar lactone lactonase YvrE
MEHPGGVAISGDGLIYIADTFNNRIQVYALR